MKRKELVDINLLKRLPKEHWTEYNGRVLTVKELLDKLTNKKTKK